jgi:hypothetical protein
MPVWFVLEDEKLYLLPVQGSDTQWYRNVLENPSIRIDARGVGAEFRATPVAHAKAVKSVIERFREKYGAKDVKKYYSKFEVAVAVEMGLTTAFNASKQCHKSHLQERGEGDHRAPGDTRLVVFAQRVKTRENQGDCIQKWEHPIMSRPECQPNFNRNRKASCAENQAQNEAQRHLPIGVKTFIRHT